MDEQFIKNIENAGNAINLCKKQIASEATYICGWALSKAGVHLTEKAREKLEILLEEIL